MRCHTIVITHTHKIFEKKAHYHRTSRPLLKNDSDLTLLLRIIITNQKISMYPDDDLLSGRTLADIFYSVILTYVTNNIVCIVVWINCLRINGQVIAENEIFSHLAFYVNLHWKY